MNEFTAASRGVPSPVDKKNPEDLRLDLQDSIDEIETFCKGIQTKFSRNLKPIAKEALERVHHVLANVHTSLIGPVEYGDIESLPGFVQASVEMPYGRINAAYTTFLSNVRGMDIKPDNRTIALVEKTYTNAQTLLEDVFEAAGLPPLKPVVEALKIEGRSADPQ